MEWGSAVLEKSWKRSNLGKAASEKLPSLDPEADDGITSLLPVLLGGKRKKI